jgi:branched-chain amino acid transport system permease protein
MIQTLINGLVQGSVYGLAAMGLSLIFGVVRVPHFAHGESLMVAGMIGLILVRDDGLPLIVGILGGMAAALILGLVIGLLVFYPLRNLSEVNLLVIALGLVFIIEAAAAKIWGDQGRVIPGAPNTSVSILGADVGLMRVIIFVVAAGTAAALHFYVTSTRGGRAMKAMALNAAAARLMGIPVRRYWGLAFAIASMLAGLAGVLLGTILPIQANMGSLISLKSFIVIIFAGMGSISGAYYGGLVLGVLEALGASYVSSSYVNAFAFLFLVAVLLIRPQGLFVGGLVRD